MRHWCLPRPAKYGALSEVQRARLRALVKANREVGVNYGIPVLL